MIEVEKNPIGIFDSGIGGLSVLKAIQSELPNEDLLYVADQAHVPYGSRGMEEIRDFSEKILKYLIDQGAKIIVVACNTASAAALHFLRERYPETPIVGMEPAIKPAAERTETRAVGVLATQATFQGALYASVVERFGSDVRLFQDPCIGLVQEIELGNLEGSRSRKILQDALKPMMEANIDTVVLGCTHFPFVFPIIEKIVGPNVRLINPAPAVARQVKRILDQNGLASNNDGEGRVTYITTGKFANYRKLLDMLDFEGNSHRISWGKELIY